MCKYKTHVLKTHPDTPLGVLNPWNCKASWLF